MFAQETRSPSGARRYYCRWRWVYGATRFEMFVMMLEPVETRHSKYGTGLLWIQIASVAGDY